MNKSNLNNSFSRLLLLKLITNKQIEKLEKRDRNSFAKLMLYEDVCSKNIQQSDIKIRAKYIRKVKGTQEEFNHWAKMCSLATRGKWSEDHEIITEWVDEIDEEDFKNIIYGIYGIGREVLFDDGFVIKKRYNG